MPEFETVGTRVEDETIHLEDVAIPLAKVNGLYLRTSMGTITAEDGRKLEITLSGLCILVERAGKYILIDPSNAMKRAANLILAMEDEVAQ
jgi:hypothetical protein